MGINDQSNWSVIIIQVIEEFKEVGPFVLLTSDARTATFS